MQETWCLEKNGYSHIDIPGYKCLSKYASCGDKGGYAAYISNSLSFENVDIPNHSCDVWENIFVRVNHASGSFVVGNIYRPPRDHLASLTTFKNEFSGMLTVFDRTEHLYLAGDYNLDFPRCDPSSGINDFYELMCTFPMFPKILLPTRITNTSMTLIDNFYCKYSRNFTSIQAGILVNKLSDHQPYFLSVCFWNGAAVDSPSKPIHKRPLRQSEKLKYKNELVRYCTYYI